MIPLLCRGGDQLSSTDEKFTTSTVGAERPAGCDSAVVTETVSLREHAYTVQTFNCTHTHMRYGMVWYGKCEFI